MVVYAEWQEGTTSETLSRAFGDQYAWDTTLGYRFGNLLPHITYATIDGTASTVTPGAITGGPLPPEGINFPIAVQTSITAGLRYEVNDSAALKFEYSAVDVEDDPNELASTNNPFGANYGLFNTDFTKASPDGTVGVYSVALDVIF